MVCFSCGRPGHGVSQCPHLDETFPYMLPGWSAEKVDGRETTTISNTLRPPDPGGGGLSTVTCARTPAWILPPMGPRDRLWTPDKQTYPPLNREPVDRPVCPLVSRRLTYRSDKPLDGVVKASAITINVTSEPVGGAVPTGAVGVTRCFGITLPVCRQRTSRDELYTNKVNVFGPAGSVAVSVTPSADLAGDVAVGVASPADRAGVVIADVASLADLAGDVTIGVASSALAGVASLADLAGDVTVGVPSSAGVVTAGVTFREECGDGVGVPGDYDCVCDDFAEVASLAEHAGGVTVDRAPPADMDSVFADGMSYVEQCQEYGGLPKGVGLLLADNRLFSWKLL